MPMTWLLCALLAADPSPRLRHEAYLAVLPTAATVRLTLTSVQHSPNYGNGLRWRAAAGDGLKLGEGSIPLGETQTVELSPPAGALAVVWVDSGQNLAVAAVEGGAASVVSRAAGDTTIVKEGTFYLYQPAGEEGKLSVGASVTGETCRVVIEAGGETLVDKSDDFDKPETFTIPKADAARVVTLKILKPDVGNLDDVELRVLSGLAPHLALGAADAETLGKRWVQWQAAHD